VDKIKVILISSVRPAPTSAGELILYRHLVGQADIELKIYGGEPDGLTATAFFRRLAANVGRVIGPKFAGDIWALWAGRWIDPALPRQVEADERTVVATVAHGDGFMAAARFARQHSLPLVSFFQDWWPDMAEAHAWAKPLLEKQFRSLAKQSSVAICVSDGMKQTLASPNCVVLPPIAAKARATLTSSNAGEPMKVVYFGNLAEYGPMLAEAMRASLERPSIDFVVRGFPPHWPQEFSEEMRLAGKLLDFAPRGELDAWLENADAFLVPMVFDPAMRRRMETSFPSKLVELAQLGKPLVVWGPEYCSAVAWARRTGAALCVTDPDAKVLAAALERLAKSPDERAALAAAAAKIADHEWDPAAIQRDWRSVLDKLFVVRGGWCEQKIPVSEAGNLVRG